MVAQWDDSSNSSVTRHGYRSQGNTTSDTLAGDAVFTGAAEDVSGFASISVFVFSDVASASGGLSLELSTDGTNWDRSKTVTVEAGASQVHSLMVVAQFFRIVYTNGSSAQTSFRLQALYHVARPRDLSSGTSQSLQVWDDTTLVRPTSSFVADVNFGRVAYVNSVQKFGRNDAVGTGAYEDIWLGGGSYNWLQAASALRVRAGGNAADDAAGAGAQSITIEGLDENFDAASETVATAGASASDPTTTTFSRVNRAYVGATGAYTGNNTAAVLIETTGGTLVAQIEAGAGQTQLGLYSVPRLKTAYLTRVRFIVSAGTNKTASLRFWKRENADDVTTPYSPKRLIEAFDEVAGEVQIQFEAWPAIPGPADIWGSAIGDSNDTLVDLSFDLFEVDN